MHRNRQRKKSNTWTFFELIATVADMNDLFFKRLNSVVTPSEFVSIDFEDDSSDDLGDYLHQYHDQLEKV